MAGRPAIDLELEVRVQRLVLDANERGLLTAAHDCGDGGLAVALAECCIAGGVGLDAADADLGARLDAALFGETQSRFVLGVRDEAAFEAVAGLAGEADVPIARLGIAGGAGLRLGPVDVAVDDLREAYEAGLPRALMGEGAEPAVGRRA